MNEKKFKLISVDSSGTNAFFINEKFSDLFEILDPIKSFKSVGRLYSEEQQKKMDEFVSFRQKQIEKDPECPVCYTHFSQINSMIQCQVCKSSVCSKCASGIIKSNDSWKCPCCRDEQINFVQYKYPNRVIVKKLTIQSWVFKLFYMNFKQTGRNFFGKEIVSN